MEPDNSQILHALKEHYIDSEIFEPLGILEVINYEVSIGAMSERTTVVVRVACSDGKVRVLKYQEYHRFGGHMDPPDQDFECEEIDYEARSTC
jgi:hypothetical protein